jgi:hypothetical protein
MRVIAQYVDVELDANGNPLEKDTPGGELIDVLIDEDDADDLNFILRRYNRKVPIFKTEKGVTRLQSKILDKIPGQESTFRDLSSTNAEVRNIATELVGPDPKRAEKLVKVVAPFKILGYDAIYRLWSARVRHSDPTKAFPFFSITTPKVGESYSFPTVPTTSIVNIIAELRPPVGGKATGRGELLFALLTGGIAGDKTCDIVINEVDRWEVKDITKGDARVGEVTSKYFREELKDPEILTALRKTETFDSLNEVQTNKIKIAWESATEHLAGFVLVNGNKFSCVKSEELRVVSIGNEGRIDVREKSRGLPTRRPKKKKPENSPTENSPTENSPTENSPTENTEILKIV